MKIAWIVLIAVLMVFTGISSVGAEPADQVIRIGIVTDGPWARHTETVDLFKKEILALTRDEFDIEFPAELSIDGKWTKDGINNAIDTLLSNTDVDIIIALGYVASHEIAQRRDLPKPVIAAFILDAEVQRLPLKDGASGIDNLTYINLFKTVGRNIQAFKEVTPFNNLTVFADSLIVQSIPELKERAIEIARIWRLLLLRH
jgi:hypothetical protein